jgi:hypothetical protein
MISQLALKSFKKTNSCVNRQFFGFFARLHRKYFILYFWQQIHSWKLFTPKLRALNHLRQGGKEFFQF